MELKVKTKEREYPIQFKEDFSALRQALEEAGLGGRKVFVVTDSHVAALYGSQVEAQLGDAYGGCVAFPAGEDQKNLQTITTFYDAFLAAHMDRKSVVVALGGGVPGDMAGFAAATFQRGIPFFQVPTTLLAQLDSSVGGKVAVDYRGHKNMVGAFYQPHFVYINLKTLKTLPAREFAAGMAEVVKYGLIWDEAFFTFLEEQKEAILAQEEAPLTQMLYHCCRIKAEVVSQDEKEGGLREVLNFGHTIGHAVETEKHFALLHGECVALGSRAILALCEKEGRISAKDRQRAEALFDFFGLPKTVDGLSAEQVYEQMFFDKKVRNGVIQFVLLQGIGRAERTSQVGRDEVISAIKTILE